MTRDEFIVLSELCDRADGLGPWADDLYAQNVNRAAAGTALTDAGLIDRRTGNPTAAGRAALEPYRVTNAVILAAGAATRFIPLSLELPKGLYEVRGERLIERQIEQLREAGIDDITVVLGYKKEMFFYLREKYRVKFVFNAAYNVKNNIESIVLAKDALRNTYICCCDDYFPQNPFRRWEYRPFVSGYETDRRENEMYAETDADGRILRMRPGQDGGLVLMGHAYWTRDFAQAFLSLAEADRELGIYDAFFWEWLVKDNLESLPPLYFRAYDPDAIFEFDSLAQLRAFDERYVGHTNSRIIRNIKLVFRCDEEDVVDFRNVNEGLTNTSFIFRIDGEDYIYRHPGDGTERIIDRKNEKTSLETAKRLGFDPTYIYMDVNEGWKISRFVPAFREPDYESFEDSKRVIETMRALHASDAVVDYGMRPWEDALAMEALLKKQDPNCFESFEPLKEKIGRLYELTKTDGVGRICFCHGDTYRHNWMLLPDDSVILIDWEYAGMSDPGIDVGYYIVDAMYDFGQARAFIREYLGDGYSEAGEFHYMAYTALIAYYWFVWALYRESCGAIMGESLYNWYEMARKYVDYMIP